jgi:hypothetical protein
MRTISYLTVAIFINTCKSERTKVVPKGLDEIYHGNVSKKANKKVLHVIFRH